MSVAVRTTPEADTQIRDIEDWWRTNRPAAPDRFLEEVAAAIEIVGHTPQIGRVYRSSPIPGTRRMLLKKTRYHLYYVVEGSEAIVMAVWHARRGAGPPLRMNRT